LSATLPFVNLSPGLRVGSELSVTRPFRAQREYESAILFKQQLQQDTQSTTPGPDVQSDALINYIRRVESRTDRVAINHGAEKPVDPESPVNWGENGQFSEGSPLLPLPALFHEVAALWQTQLHALGARQREVRRSFHLRPRQKEIALHSRLLLLSGY